MTKTKEPRSGALLGSEVVRLLDDLGHDASADGAATFADSEAKTLLHSDGGEQLHLEGDGVTRHDHFLVGG